MRTVLYALFTLSGAAGLIYEMGWSRYLALFLGHSAYAQVLVIGIFLGGMALGALAVGARTERWRDPLMWYVGAEVAIGLIGFLFHDVYLVTTGFAYDVVFPALAGTVLLTPFKWMLAAFLILPQSILLGATFPLMAAGVLRRTGERPGGVLAWLYFTNSFGAAVGVLLAGFVLLAWAGLPGTLLVAAIINLTVALIALSVARRVAAAGKLQISEVATGVPTEVPEAPALPVERLTRLLLAVSFGTAVASFAYEIGWLRMLALVLGSATHSFELMLSAFILGLAAGSFWVRRRADGWRRPLRVLGIVQLAMGACALATLTLYGASFYWTAGLLATFAPSEAGYVGFTLARYGVCLAIMFPASFCAGMTLPLITRTLLMARVGERSIGAVYGVNTLGAIVGVALAGLVLLPWVGLKGVIVGGASLDLALGVLVLMTDAGRSVVARRLAYGGLTVAVVLAGVGALSPGFDRRLLISGVYRHGLIPEEGDFTSLFYRDGRTATVDVTQNHTLGHVSIHTNGKPDPHIAVRPGPCAGRSGGGGGRPGLGDVLALPAGEPAARGGGDRGDRAGDGAGLEGVLSAQSTGVRRSALDHRDRGRQDVLCRGQPPVRHHPLRAIQPLGQRRREPLHHGVLPARDALSGRRRRVWAVAATVRDRRCPGSDGAGGDPPELRCLRGLPDARH
jgi:predicted membrane-bound spermidine synthase